MQPLDAAVAADADAAGQARAVAVERDDQRLVEAAGVVGVGGVARRGARRASASSASRSSSSADFELLVPLAMERRRVAAPLLASRAWRRCARRRPRWPGRDRPASSRTPSPSARSDRAGRESAPSRSGTRAAASRIRSPVVAGCRVVEELALVREVPLEQPRLLLPAEKRVGDDVDVLGCERRCARGASCSACHGNPLCSFTRVNRSSPAANRTVPSSTIR